MLAASPEAEPPGAAHAAPPGRIALDEDVSPVAGRRFSRR